MITLTALSHLTMQAKIYGALRRAIQRKNKGKHIVIHNRHGKPFLLVWYVTGIAARQNGLWFSGFVFQDANGKNVSDVVLQSLKG